MAHHKIQVACEACGASGLYVGMAERNGAAVVCAKCRGTGASTIEYDDFEGRREKRGVRRVYEVNPGICIGEGNGHTLEDFGGVPYAEWQRRGALAFERKTENRAYTCPAWWYQSADYKRRPDWTECRKTLGLSFSACPYFPAKEKCWQRFDEEGR